MAGAREKAWSEKKKFREGQAEQVLDDLFFHFIDIAKRLKPKVIVAENVKGLIQGNARGYVRDIFKAFTSAGYETQLFLLNSSRMGVPQSRERTFFISRRKDLDLPKIKLDFNEPVISVATAIKGCKDDGLELSPSLKADFLRIKNKQEQKYFSVSIANPLKPCPTITSMSASSAGSVMHWDGRKFSFDEIKRISTFPDDYDFQNLNGGYVCGMSVPPFMMMRVAAEIGRQLFKIEI